MMKYFLNLLFISALSASPLWSSSYNRIEITQGQVKPEPIAIHNFSSENGSPIASEIAQIMRENLKKSGLFISLNPEDYAHLMNSENPQLPQWKQLQVRYVVTGRAEEEGNTIRLTFTLHNVMTGRKMIEKITLQGKPGSVRQLSHIASDAVFERITGEKGFFNSKIIFIDEVGSRVKRKKKLAIMDWDGHNVHYLTDGHNLVLTPRFSRNNREVAFLSFNKVRNLSSIREKAHVHLMDLHSGKRNSLGNFEGMTFSPFFSKNGEKILLSFAKNGKTSIYIMDRTKRKISPLTRPSSIDTSPCFTEDEQSIVFTSDRGGNEQIYMMNADGSNVRRISFGGGKYSQPSVSPRGDKIVFSKQHQGYFYLGIMNIDGSGERLLHKTRNVIERPNWAPNGRYILFTEEDISPAGKGHLIMIDVTGHHKIPLKTPHGASDGVWSNLLHNPLA